MLLGFGIAGSGGDAVGIYPSYCRTQPAFHTQFGQRLADDGTRPRSQIRSDLVGTLHDDDLDIRILAQHGAQATG